jgi:hypothetical protein
VSVDAIRKDPMDLFRWLGKAATGELTASILGALVIASCSRATRASPPSRSRRSSSIPCS